MKKLNEKGFAVSTLLYGLMLVAFLVVSLLMSIMSTNRKNTNTLVKKIEEELNRYSQTTTEFTSTDGTQEFIVPYGKAGWYKIELWGAAAKNADATSNSTDKKGGYTSGVLYLEENTHLYFQIGSVGGSGGTKNNTSTTYGGGATDVRLVGGAWNNAAGLASRIMVAAGGGYNSSNKGTGYTTGYYSGNNGYTYISGYGVAASHPTYSFINTHLMHSVNPGAGKATIELISTNDRNNPPAKKTNVLDSVRYIKDCITSTKATVSKERWTEIQAYDSHGQNVALAKTAKIGSYSVPKLVNGIKDDDITTTYSSGSGEKCVVVDLGATYSLEEIVIFHRADDTTDRKYTTEKIMVSTNNSSYTTLKSWTAISYAPAETDLGIRYSARDLEGNSTMSIPTGNYYIHNSLSILSAVTSQGDNAVLLKNNGQKGQRWAIAPTGDGYYSIVEASNSRALQPVDGALEVDEFVGTTTEYQKHAWEEWSISGLNNGFYLLRSRANGSLCLSGTSASSGPLKVTTCNTTDQNQWFKLVNADY